MLDSADPRKESAGRTILEQEPSLDANLSDELWDDIDLEEFDPHRGQGEEEPTFESQGINFASPRDQI